MPANYARYLIGTQRTAESNRELGFVLAFVSGVLVVRWLLDFVSRHGFVLFGWWRIIVGVIALVALLLGF